MVGILYSDNEFRYFDEHRPSSEAARRYVQAPLKSFDRLGEVAELKPAIDPYDRLAGYVIDRRDECVRSYAEAAGIDLLDPEVRADVVAHITKMSA